MSLDKIENAHHTLIKVRGVPRLYRSTYNRVYYARKSRGGRVFTHSCRTSSLAKAKEVLPTVLEAIDRKMEQVFAVTFTGSPTGGGPSTKGRRITFKDGLELSFATRLSAGHKWHTTNNLTFQLRVLREHAVPLWGDKTVDQIDSTEVHAFLQKLLEDGKKTSTRNTYLSNLRRVFQDMIECDRRRGVQKVVDNPASFIRKIPQKRTLRIPELADVNRVLDSAAKGSPEVARFARGLLLTGARVNELMRMTWEDIDLARRVMHIPNSKGKVGQYGEDGFRSVPMPEETHDFFYDLMAFRKPRKASELIFPAKPNNVSTVRGLLRAHAAKVGAPHITSHMLRHAFATVCLQNGVDVPTVAEWLGHSDGGALVLKTYSHVLKSHSEEMARKVKFTTP